MKIDATQALKDFDMRNQAYARRQQKKFTQVKNKNSTEQYWQNGKNRERQPSVMSINAKND